MSNLARIEIEIQSIEAQSVTDSGPLRVMLAVAGGASPERGPLRVIVPPHSAVRLKAHRVGGLLSIGPVLAREPEGDAWRTTTARVRVRCTSI